ALELHGEPHSLRHVLHDTEPRHNHLLVLAVLPGARGATDGGGRCAVPDPRQRHGSGGPRQPHAFDLEVRTPNPGEIWAETRPSDKCGPLWWRSMAQYIADLTGVCGCAWGVVGSSTDEVVQKTKKHAAEAHQMREV